jgi:hypothetical protein
MTCLFGVGTGNTCYHRWWDGSSWGGWENCGGHPRIGSHRHIFGVNDLSLVGIGTDSAIYCNTGIVPPAQAGAVSVISSQVFPLLFPGQRAESMSSVSARIVLRTINTIMEHGQPGGRIWVEFPFLL